MSRRGLTAGRRRSIFAAPVAAPEVLYASSHFWGNGSGTNNALGPPDGTFTTDTGAASWSARFEFPTPTTPGQAGASRSFSITLRRSAAGGTDPNIAIQLQNGVMGNVANARATSLISRPVGEGVLTYSAGFTHAELPDLTNVVAFVIVTASVDRTIQVDSVALTVGTADVPTSVGMAQPSGTTLVRDLSRAGYWEPEGIGYLDQLSELGPDGEPVLRSTLVDGMSGATSGTPSERNDLRAGDAPLNAVRWVTWWERFVQMPTTALDRWQLIGPNEIHGYTVAQAPISPEVDTSKRRRMNANAGRSTTRYFDIGPIVIGQWYQCHFALLHSTGTDGYWEWWRDGVKVAEMRNEATTLDTNGGYWKFAHYRNAEINGTSVYDISSCRIFSE